MNAPLRLLRPVALATAFAAAVPATNPTSLLRAQQEPELPDARAYRSLAVGGPAFLGTARPAVLVGWLYQISLAPMRTGFEGEMQVRRAPTWYLHLSASVGRSFASQPDRGPLAIGGVGVVRRVQPSFVSAAGPVALGVAGPAAWGAAFRVEIADNIGVQAGWTRRTRTGEDRAVLSVDLLSCLLEDLGLGPCITPDLQ